jgi:hypothetical protein
MNAMVSLKGYFIDNKHIHIHTELHSISNCYITLMIIDKNELAHFQLNTALLPN